MSTGRETIAIRAHLSNLWDSEDILDSIWRLCASPLMTVLILLSLAGVICLGSVLPQLPDGTTSNPVAGSLWLTSVRNRYGSSTDWLLAAGLLNIYNSLWIRVPIGLLALNVSLVTIQLVLRQPPPTPATPVSIDELAGSIPPGQSSDRWLSNLWSNLRQLGYVRIDNSSEWVFAARYARCPLVLCSGVLLLLAGVGISHRLAWWEHEVMLRPQQVLPLGHGTGLRARADAIEPTRSTLGPNQSVRTTLHILHEAREPRELVLESYRPLLYSGLWFHHGAAGSAVSVQAQDSLGRTLTMETIGAEGGQSTELYLQFRQESAPGYLVVLDLASSTPASRSFEQRGDDKWIWVPARDLTLNLMYIPAQGAEASSSFFLRAFRGAEPVPFTESQFQAAADIHIAGDVFQFTPQRYVLLRFGSDWGLPLIIVAPIVIVIGWSLLCWRTPRTLWLRFQPTPDQWTVHLLTSHPGSTQQKWYQDLVHVISTSLNPPIECKHERNRNLVGPEENGV